MSDALEEIASLRESLAATQSALREAIADARSNADALQHAEIQLAQSVCAEEQSQVLAERDAMRNERNTHSLRRQQAERERDEARANAAAFCGENERLKKECEAWRGYDRAINQTDRMARLSDALRLREENEGAAPSTVTASANAGSPGVVEQPIEPDGRTM
jgi:hypothetical protein